MENKEIYIRNAVSYITDKEAYITDIKARLKGKTALKKLEFLDQRIAEHENDKTIFESEAERLGSDCEVHFFREYQTFYPIQLEAEKIDILEGMAERLIEKYPKLCKQLNPNEYTQLNQTVAIFYLLKKAGLDLDKVTDLHITEVIQFLTGDKNISSRSTEIRKYVKQCRTDSDTFSKKNIEFIVGKINILKGLESVSYEIETKKVKEEKKKV
jgi:hypothetical protein